MSDLNDPPATERPLAVLTLRAAGDLPPQEAARVATWLEAQAARLRTPERLEYAPRYTARIWL